MEDFWESVFQNPARAKALLSINPCEAAKVDFLRKVNLASSFQKMSKIFSEAVRTKSCSQEEHDLFKDRILCDGYINPMVPNKKIVYYRKILITEKLHGIDPPPEGYELTVTFKRTSGYTTTLYNGTHCEYNPCYDHVFKFFLTNLSSKVNPTGSTLEVDVRPPSNNSYWEDIHAPLYWVDVYRGHLLAFTGSKFRRLKIVDDRILWDVIEVQAHEYESDDEIDFVKSLYRFVIDKTTPVPTLLRIETSFENIELTRYGDVLEPESGKYTLNSEPFGFHYRPRTTPVPFTFERLLYYDHSTSSDGDLVQDFDEDIGFTSPAVDHHGNIWIRGETMLTIFAPDLKWKHKVALKESANFNFFPTAEGDVLAVSKDSTRRHFWHFSLKKYNMDDD